MICFFDYVLPPYQCHMPRFNSSLIMFIQIEAKYNVRAAFAFLFHFPQKNFPEESSVRFEEILSYVIQLTCNKRGSWCCNL